MVVYYLRRFYHKPDYKFFDAGFARENNVIHDIRNCLTLIYHGYIIHTMQRVNHHLSDVQMKNLKKLADKTGLSVAEHIRRAVDAYLKDSKKGG